MALELRIWLNIFFSYNCIGSHLLNYGVPQGVILARWSFCVYSSYFQFLEDTKFSFRPNSLHDLLNYSMQKAHSSLVSLELPSWLDSRIVILDPFSSCVDSLSVLTTPEVPQGSHLCPILFSLLTASFPIVCYKVQCYQLPDRK